MLFCLPCILPGFVLVPDRYTAHRPGESGVTVILRHDRRHEFGKPFRERVARGRVHVPAMVDRLHRPGFVRRGFRELFPVQAVHRIVADLVVDHVLETERIIGGRIGRVYDDGGGRCPVPGPGIDLEYRPAHLLERVHVQRKAAVQLLPEVVRIEFERIGSLIVEHQGGGKAVQGLLVRLLLHHGEDINVLLQVALPGVVEHVGISGLLIYSGIADAEIVRIPFPVRELNDELVLFAGFGHGRYLKLSVLVR